MFEGTILNLIMFLIVASMGAILGFIVTLQRSLFIRTLYHMMTFILLPVISLGITTVIAGNIALSLGMIGALSIVRFRNPVKNPFELASYFLLVTIGIAAGVDLIYACILFAFCVVVILGFSCVDYFNPSFFKNSVHEYNSTIVYIVSNVQCTDYLLNIGEIDNSQFDKDTAEYSYRIKTKLKMKKIEDLVFGMPGLVRYTVQNA